MIGHDWHCMVGSLFFKCVCIAMAKKVVVFVSGRIKINLSSMVCQGEFLLPPSFNTHQGDVGGHLSPLGGRAGDRALVMDVWPQTRLILVKI